MTPADLYRACKFSAWRLETLQDYAGDEDGRQRAFLAGKPLPPPGPDKCASLELIARLRQAGKFLQRVHIVSRPLTDYMRYELAVYPENVAAGENVRIADLSAHPELASLGGDFAVFDAGTPSATVILFHYSDSGGVLGYKHIADAATVRDCARRYAIALNVSVSLEEFMAAAG